MTKVTHRKRYQQLLSALKQARLRLKLQQVVVSKRLGQYPNFMTKVESGERKIDPIELLELCHLYGISYQKLLKLAGLDSR